MVKVVSQGIFNETVLENKELLDLNTEEAIEETIKQFEAQGVDLTNIIKDPFILDKENPVSLLVSKLQLTSDDNEILTCVNGLKILCERGIEYKLLCGKEHVYDTVLSKLSSDMLPNLQENILEFLAVLLDGYPDILDERGCDIFLKILENSSFGIQKIIFKLIDVTCLRHEKNRQMYMENGIILCIARFLSNKPSNDLLCSILNTIPALTRDDDIRTETSKRYVHACNLSSDLLKPFCLLLKDKEDEDPFIVESLLKAFSSIVVNNDHCSIVDDEGCLPVIINLVKKYRQNEKILAKCFIFLFGLVGNDDVNVKVMRLDVAPELALAMNSYIVNK